LRPEFDFNDEIDFVEEGMLDSYDIMSLVSELEIMYGIIIDNMDLLPEHFSSLESIEALIKKNKTSTAL
jgi:acyl carrier protein